MAWNGLKEWTRGGAEFCHLHGFSFLLQLIFPEMHIAVPLLQPVLCNLVGIILVRLMVTTIVIRLLMRMMMKLTMIDSEADDTFSFFLV